MWKIMGIRCKRKIEITIKNELKNGDRKVKIFRRIKRIEKTKRIITSQDWTLNFLKGKEA